MIRFEAALLAEDLSREFKSWCWVAGGKVLRSFCANGIEAGLLPHGIQIASQFFPLKKGDLVLLKDPQVGGPGRDRLTLVQCLREERAQEPAIFFASVFQAPTTAGMKLPPIPLRNQGEVNEAVMQALGDCHERLRQEIQRQDRLRELALKQSFAPLWQGSRLSSDFNREKSRMKELIADLPEGDVTSELGWGREQIRVQIEVESSSIHFNLTGTSPSLHHALSLPATSGVIRSTVREWLGWPKALSAVCSDLIDLRVPTGCLLNNASSQSSADDTMDLSVALLKTAVESALHRWDRRVKRGFTNYFDAKVSLLFGDRAPVTLALPSGSAATDKNEGVSFFQQRACEMPFSPERLESSCPVLLESVLQGKAPEKSEAATAGGTGLVIALKALEAGQIKWEKPPAFKMPPIKGKSPFTLPEVVIQREGETLPLASSGPHAFKKGDILSIRSGSGGGLE